MKKVLFLLGFILIFTQSAQAQNYGFYGGGAAPLSLPFGYYGAPARVYTVIPVVPNITITQPGVGLIQPGFGQIGQPTPQIGVGVTQGIPGLGANIPGFDFTQPGPVQPGLGITVPSFTIR